MQYTNRLFYGKTYRLKKGCYLMYKIFQIFRVSEARETDKWRGS